MLGLLASRDRENQQSVGTAFRWFTIAAQQGGAEAASKIQGNLAHCRSALTPDELQKEQEAAQLWIEQHPNTDLFVFDGIRSEVPVGEIYAMRASATE